VRCLSEEQAQTPKGLWRYHGRGRRVSERVWSSEWIGDGGQSAERRNANHACGSAMRLRVFVPGVALGLWPRNGGSGDERGDNNDV